MPTLEEKVNFGKLIDTQIRQGNYISAEYLVNAAPQDFLEGFPVQPFYATVALQLTMDAENASKETREIYKTLIDYYKNKAGECLAVKPIRKFLRALRII